MKLTQADIWLSKCIRERAHWICEKCNYEDVSGQASGTSKFIQHSHFIGRKHKATRYKAENGLCLCASCHAIVEHDPGLHTRLFEQIMGQGLAEILTESKQKPFKPLGGWRSYEKEASKFYKQEFERMRELRKEGVMGRIEFESYE